MSDERHIELTHGEIDGTNSLAESAELRGLVERDPTAREFLQDMKQLSEVLDRVEDAEVPQGLRGSIRSAIAASKDVSPPIPLRKRKPRIPAGTPGLRLATALAAGVVLGLIVGPRIFNDAGGWNPSDFGGAMMRGSRITEPVDLDADRFSAAFRGVQNGDRLLVTFDIEAQAPAEVTVEYDIGKFELTGFARRGGHFDVLEARDGRFIIHGEQDFRGNLLLERLDPAETTLRLSIRRDGAQLDEELLKLDRMK